MVKYTMVLLALLLAFPAQGHIGKPSASGNTSLECLTSLIHYEARGEPKRGKYAVAFVVMNRAEIRNMTVCEVIKERGQFSWIPTKQIKLFPQHIDIAFDVLYNLRTNFIPGVEYFFADWIPRPAWSRNLKFVEKIGGHLFWRK